MKVRLLDLGAVAVAIAILIGSLWAMSIQRVDPGIHLAYRNGNVVIGSIDYASLASEGYYGLEEGNVVVGLDDLDLTTLSPEQKQSIPSQPWNWTSIDVIVSSSRGVIDVSPVGIGLAVDSGNPTIGWTLLRPDQTGDMFPIGLGLVILGLGWWWLGSGRGGDGLRRYALTLPVATAMPILILPLNRFPTLAAVAIGSGLVAVAMLPFAFDLASALPTRPRQLALALPAIGFTALAAAVGILVPLDIRTGSYSYSTLHAMLVAAIPIIPGIVASRPMNWLSTSPGDEHSGIFAAPELLVASVTPAVAAISLIPPSEYYLWPILSWLAVIVVARQLLRPATKQAARATHQLDLVVAATEAERARIAADVHDDALQDLTILVRRLDAAGDTANAQAAREIAERLRAIVGDLRLPVLDDLGVGPSLEWLCERLDSPAGSITLDRLPDESRQPANVELAVFRIAQEALANAVRHGKPPIIVRFVTGRDWVELEVDDSGYGIPAGAAELAEQTGHLGLMNMAQRAEAIGASLKIGRRPGGGTRVGFVWERVVAPDAAPATA
jgi:signal transduction histidine kinase